MITLLLISILLSTLTLFYCVLTAEEEPVPFNNSKWLSIKEQVKLNLIVDDMDDDEIEDEINRQTDQIYFNGQD
jgi:hypothetical protein